MNRARRSPPDQIPASYYARPAGAAPRPGRAAGRPWTPDPRGWPVRTRALALVACGAAAACAALAAWRPAVGLLAALGLTCAALAADAGGLRHRVPLLRSANAAHAAGAWGVIGCVLLVGLALALRPSGPSEPAGARVAGRTPPAAPAAAPGPATPAATGAAPAPTPTPTPLPTSTPTPTPSPTSRAEPAPPAPAVTFLNAPLSARTGQPVTLLARTSPNTSCSIVVGTSPPPELEPATSSATGDVSWSWRTNRQTPPGSWPITVTCGRAAATTAIVVH
jgi:hypothetical protein